MHPQSPLLHMLRIHPLYPSGLLRASRLLTLTRPIQFSLPPANSSSRAPFSSSQSPPSPAASEPSSPYPQDETKTPAQPAAQIQTRTFTHHITLFTRPNCSLCTDARGVLAAVWERRPFVFTEMDVMEGVGEEEKNERQRIRKAWRELYEFDTPVIHITRLLVPITVKRASSTASSSSSQLHSDRKADGKRGKRTPEASGTLEPDGSEIPAEDPRLVGRARKLMHRFTINEVLGAMDN